MKHNFLNTVVILTMAVCTFTAIPQKASALTASDNDMNKSISQSEGSSNTELNSPSSIIVTDKRNNNKSINQINTMNNKSMNKDEAKQILMNADGDYINKTLSNRKNASLNYDRQSNAMNINQFYNIIDEPCYVFSLTYDYNDLFTAADSVYYVGMNSRKVYVINGDSAQFYSYEVSSNRKVNSFVSKITDASIQWHD